MGDKAHALENYDMALATYTSVYGEQHETTERVRSDRAACEVQEEVQAVEVQVSYPTAIE
jgi:hypothetical protein